jgi:multisubunit Na+/H+ antiporter MnhC subunit
MKQEFPSSVILRTRNHSVLDKQWRMNQDRMVDAVNMAMVITTIVLSIAMTATAIYMTFFCDWRI